MRGKFIKGMTAGALVGAAAGVMLMPELSRNTKKRIQRSKRMIGNAAGDIYDNLMDWMK